LSVNTSKAVAKEKPSVKLPVIIAAAVVLVVFLAWYGHKIFSPPANVENELTDKKQAFMMKIAKEAGPTADLTKLSPADLAEFKSETSGSPRSPEEILKQYVANHNIR